MKFSKKLSLRLASVSCSRNPWLPSLRVQCGKPRSAEAHTELRLGEIIQLETGKGNNVPKDYDP